jgi:hypothetical protein
MQKDNLKKETPAFGNTVLPAGAKWLERQYYCKNFSLSDYERCGDYMKKQNENKDDYIILKIDYNPMKNTCKFIDKVRL